MIPYGKHSVEQQDIDAVVDVLKHQFLTQGQQVPAFENALSSYCGATFAVAVNSGTSALHIACMAIELGPGDVLWTSPNSFVASANCALYCHAAVDFVDIDPHTRNICPQALSEKLASCSQLPKAIVVVHFAGSSCDMQAIHQIANAYDVTVIEDASHALGGDYQNQKVGACTYSDMTVLSFHPVKSITSAEGGAVLTNSSSLHQKLVLHSKHGITRDPELMHQAMPEPWYYEQISLGYNYRLSDLHAALGLSQLRRVDEFIARRRALARRYHEHLSALPITLPQADPHSAWHIYVIEVAAEQRLSVFKHLSAAGIGVNVHYIPIHLQPYYRNMGFKAGDFPNAEKYYSGAITLPIHPQLSDEQQDIIIATLKELLG